MAQRRLSALALAVAAAAILAGCTSAVDNGASEPATPSTILVTKENEEESLTNSSFQMAAHTHDYWGGRERLLILDESRPSDGPWLSDGWTEVFVPPDGVVVPQGAERVEVTVTWAGTEGAFVPELWVKTAADAEAILVGSVPQTETFVLETIHAQADLPHQSLSAWRFEWRIPDMEAPAVWDASVSMKAEAVRGLEIPLYPPHPDLWQGAEALPLLHAGQESGVWVMPLGLCFEGCRVAFSPDSGSIVPYDAAALEITLQHGSDSPTQLELMYHGADSREWQSPQPTASGGGRATYVIPVEPMNADSPYATQSLWEFTVYVAGPVADSVKSGSYTIEGRVLKNLP